MTLSPRRLDDRALRRLSDAIGAAVVAALVGLVWFHIYRPLAARRAESRAEVTHLDELWRDRQRIETAYARQTAARDEAARDLDLWRRRVPAVTAEAEFLGQLSDAAAGVGVRLDDFRIDGVRSVSDCPAIETRATLRASYPDLCLLLDRIERLPRYCRVARFHIDADDAADARHRVSLTLLAFFRPAAAGPSPP